MKPSDFFNDIVTACEEQAAAAVRSLTNNGIEVDMRLYYLPAAGRWNGQLLLVQNGDPVPAGFILAPEGDRFGGSIPYASYWSWVRSHSMRLGILGDERVAQ